MESTLVFIALFLVSSGASVEDDKRSNLQALYEVAADRVVKTTAEQIETANALAALHPAADLEPSKPADEHFIGAAESKKDAAQMNDRVKYLELRVAEASAKRARDKNEQAWFWLRWLQQIGLSCHLVSAIAAAKVPVEIAVERKIWILSNSAKIGETIALKAEKYGLSEEVAASAGESIGSFLKSELSRGVQVALAAATIATAYFDIRDAEANAATCQLAGKPVESKLVEGESPSLDSAAESLQRTAAEAREQELKNSTQRLYTLTFCLVALIAFTLLRLSGVIRKGGTAPSEPKKQGVEEKSEGES